MSHPLGLKRENTDKLVSSAQVRIEDWLNTMSDLNTSLNAPGEPFYWQRDELCTTMQRQYFLCSAYTEMVQLSTSSSS